MLVTFGCNNSQDDVYLESSQQFNKHLTSYAMNQKFLLNKALTRAGDNASKEVVMEIAQEIDENMQTFKEENKDFLITLDNLTDDEMELMLLEPTHMLSYLEDNFSKKTYKYASDFLNGDLQVDVSHVISDIELTPSEKTFISNLIIASEFIELTENIDNDGLDNPVRSIRDPRQAKMDMCFNDYACDLRECSLNFLGGAISGAAYGPWGSIIGGAVSYALCAYGAKKTYNRCIR